MRREPDHQLPLLGGRAIYMDSPLVRYWLDINAARAHVANDPAVVGGSLGDDGLFGYGGNDTLYGDGYIYVDNAQVVHTEVDAGSEGLGVRAHRSLEAVGRLGGDEFVALLPEVHSDADAERVALRILEVMRDPIFVGGQECFVTASVGVALFEDTPSNFRSFFSAEIEKWRNVVKKTNMKLE